MRKAMLAGALALAMIGSSAAIAQAGDFVVTEAQIAQFKTMLKLTPAQERHWAPVEAALRELARRQAQQQAAAEGIVQRVRSRVAAITLDAVGIRRLASAAVPLVKSLDEDQKRDAAQVARAMGFASVAAAF